MRITSKEIGLAVGVVAASVITWEATKNKRRALLRRVEKYIHRPHVTGKIHHRLARIEKTLEQKFHEHLPEEIVTPDLKLGVENVARAFHKAEELLSDDVPVHPLKYLEGKSDALMSRIKELEKWVKKEGIHAEVVPYIHNKVKELEKKLEGDDDDEVYVPEGGYQTNLDPRIQAMLDKD